MSCAVGAATLAVAMLGTGVASADELVGTTYDEAVGKIAGWGGKAVVGTVHGDQLEKSECVVTSWNKALFLDTSGINNRTNEYRLNLNCNNKFAAPGHPGTSVMDKKAAAAKADQQTADGINNGAEWCKQSDANMANCEAFCKRTDLCEI
jgi:hypothetical protein